MKSILRFPHRFSHTLPDAFRGQDVRLSEPLLEHFIETLSDVGDVVFDPFAGYGTTLPCAEKLGRAGYGIERDVRRCDHGRSMLREPERLRRGDVRTVELEALPEIALCIGSPPYVHADDALDPLSASGEAGDYSAYLDELRATYLAVSRRLREDGHLVIEVANLKARGRTTTLAWDLGMKLAGSLRFEGDTVIAWDDGYGHGYDHSYCLLFRPSKG